MTAAPRVPGVALEQLLGHGRFGEVHAGREEALGRRVAVKVLPRIDELRIADFAALLHDIVEASPHPALVTATGWVRAEDGRPCVLAEQMVTSLEDHVAIQGGLTVRDVVGVARRLAAGLGALHERGIVHGDVRPANVMIDRWGRPQIDDAGIAAFLSGPTGLSRSQAQPGTMAHLAPEVLSDGPATPATDVFGLAATLYSLVAERPPFTHGIADPGTVMARLWRGDVLDLRERGLPDGIWRVLGRALDPDPDRRPATPGLLAEALSTAAALGAMGPEETMGRLAPPRPTDPPVSSRHNPALPLLPPQPPPVPTPHPAPDSTLSRETVTIPVAPPPLPTAPPPLPTASPPLPDDAEPAGPGPSPRAGRGVLLGAGAVAVLVLVAVVAWPRGATEPSAQDVAVIDGPTGEVVPVPRPSATAEIATAPAPAPSRPAPALPAAPPPLPIPLSGPDTPPPAGVEVLIGRGLGVGGPATGLHLARGEGMSVAADGTTVLADRAAHRVYRVAPDGTAAVLAGTGHPGAAGDGGPANRAELNDPYGVAGDGDVVVVADRGNGLIRRIDTDDTITTFAGGPGSLFSPDTPPHGLALGRDGTVYATIVTQGLVVAVSPDGTERIIAGTGALGSTGDGGPATDAQLNAPTGVAVDGDELIVIELGQRANGGGGPTGRVRRLRPGAEGWTIDAEPGGDGLNRPEGVAVAPDGTIIVTSTFDNQVIAIREGQQQLVAGNGGAGSGGDGGPADLATLNRPKGVAVGPDGEVLVSEGAAPFVRRVDPDGGIATVIGRRVPAGPVPAAEVGLVLPNGIAEIPAGGVVVDDLATQAVLEVVAGTARSRTDGTAAIGAPSGLAMDDEGAIYISDPPRHVIYRLTPDGVLDVFAGQPAQRPVQTTSQAIRDGQPATEAFLSFPRGLDWHDGTLYVADSLAHRVRAIGPDGVIRTVVGDGGDPDGPATSALDLPHDVDVEGRAMVIADSGSHTVRHVDLVSGEVTTLGGRDGQAGAAGGDGPATELRLSLPQAVAWLPAGGVAVADTRNRRVVVIDDDRARTVLGGNGTPLPDLRPVALAIDGVTGRLHVVDQAARRVWSVEP